MNSNQTPLGGKLTYAQQVAMEIESQIKELDLYVKKRDRQMVQLGSRQLNHGQTIDDYPNALQPQ